jgi:hypothetical protein
MKSVLIYAIIGGVCFASSSFAQFGTAPSFAPPVQDEIEVKEAAAGDTFHRNVIRAAVKAQRNGTITRKQLIRLRVAMISPAFREQAKEMATIQMSASGNADKIPRIGENIDWDALLAFIEKLIPLILQLIEAITAVVETNDIQVDRLEPDFGVYSPFPSYQVAC